MSQAGLVAITGGVLPPAVPLQFTADDATIAVPVANNLNVFSVDTTANNDNGVRTTASGSTMTVQLTNRIQGTGTTIGAVTADLITLALGATPGTYTIEVNVSAFESTTPASAGYSIFGTVRTTGAAAVLVGTPDKIVNEEAALSTSDCTIVVSGNNAIVRATGTAALTSNWNAVGYYVLRT